MFTILVILTVIVFYMFWDVNYFIRTYFTVISGRLFNAKSDLNLESIIFGLGTFQDCDIHFKNIRLSRIIRELDFARYNFYDRTGMYSRSKEIGVKSLQGSTLVIATENLPILTPYKIITKLIYVDARSLFFEHKVVTLHDGRNRCILISRQFAMGGSTDDLLKDVPGCDTKLEEPPLIKHWLQSMLISSRNLRK